MTKHDMNHTPLQRLLALLACILIAAAFLLLLALSFTGASAGSILAVLFVIMIVPCLVYVLIHFTKKR